MPSDADRLREIAAEIAAELLTNGAGERAERLVLTTAGRDLGGWSHGPLSDRIASMLAARLDVAPAGGGVPGDVVEEIAQEAHTMGRIYERVQSPVKPALEYERVSEMVRRRIAAQPAARSGGVPGGVREAAERAERWDTDPGVLREPTDDDVCTMARWILAQPAALEERGEVEP